MSCYILCDTATRDYLLPFTYTRPVADCRVGISTIREKWERLLGQSTSTLTVDYLAEKYPLKTESDNFWINGALIPDDRLLEALVKLEPGQKLMAGNTCLITRCESLKAYESKSGLKRIDHHYDHLIIQYPWDISQNNGRELVADFTRITRGRTGCDTGETNRILHPENIFIEENASVLHATLNATDGPIYIGKDASIMEGALIRGPFALGEGAVVKMGAKIYGATTIGPCSTAGGEIKNSVLFGYSNKGHDGYLGDAVIGEFCNLGANTSCSNLKNNVGYINIWNVLDQSYTVAGIKCGVIMGDYSRTGINTMLNTGTLIAVSCNLYGADFPPRYIPSFCWGGASGFEEYRLPNALRDADAWKKLKNKQLTPEDKTILEKVFHKTVSYRKHFIHS